MNRLLLPLALLFVLPSFPQEAQLKDPAEPLETYFYPQAIPLSPPEDPFQAGIEDPESFDLKTFFQNYGVEFPVGSSVRYEPLVACVVMTNTRENHRRLYQILTKSGVDDQSVELTVQLLSVPLEDVLDLERKQEAPLNRDSVLALWRKGEAQVVHSQSVRTLSGVNTLLETAKGKPGSSRTHHLSLNMTPTVYTGGHRLTVAVIASSEEAVQGKSHSSDMPVRFQTVSTSILLTDGETVSLAHTTSVETKERIYLLLHARLVTPKPIPFDKLKLIPAP